MPISRRVHRSFEDGRCITYCCGPAGEASRKRLFRIGRNIVSPRWDTGLQYFPSQYAQEILGPRPEEDLRGRHRSRLFKTTSTPGEVLGDGRYSNQCAWKGTRLQYFNMGKATADLSSEEALARRVCFGGTKIFSSNYPFFSLSSRGRIRVRFVKLLAILTPPSYYPRQQRRQSPWSRVP